MKFLSKWLSLSFLFTFLLYIFIYYILNPILIGFNLDFLNFSKNLLSQNINSNIVVVEIDDKSYNNLWFPIDRWDFVKFLDNISSSSPSVIAFDILFEDKWKNKDIDLLLASKFKQLWNIIIWFDIKKNDIALMPYDIFLKSVLWVWYFKPIINKYNNKVYSLNPVLELNYQDGKKIFESFSFSILRAYYNYLYNKKNIDIKYDFNGQIYTFIWKKVPIKNNEFYISYNDSNKFVKESFYNIYSWKFDKTKFKDKIVLVWYTAEWVKDDFLLPWFWNIIKWVYIHANAINNILNENYIVYFNKNIEHLISFLFIFFIMVINIYFLKNKSLKFVSLLSIIFFVFIFILYSILLFLSFKISWIYLLPNNPVNFFIVLILSLFLSSIIKYKNEDNNKRILSKALSEYVSSNIADEILYSKWDVKLSWENKKITIFFSDIEGFTSISEKMSPEELVWFLRVYLSEMSNIILDNRWFINKYEWDAIMSLWWVFWSSYNYWVINACESCLLQQSKLEELNYIWEKEWKNKLNVRMWIHTWNAIIWNIWAKWRKMEFTALWDSVNLWSRLEWVNKVYWTNICVSEDVYLLSKDNFIFRYLDKIKVKWKNNHINIYELICRIWEEDDFKKDIILKFDLALRLYFDKSFKEALDIFLNLEKLWDKPSVTYIKRCKKFIQIPPDKDWDWVCIMEYK